MPPALFVLLLALLASSGALADDLEAKVKAAYLYHLTKFVDWPTLPADEIRICVTGAEAVGGMLTGLANRPVRDRPLRIEVGNIGDPARCQILFIGEADKQPADWLRRLRGASVLTVGDQAGFIRQGGIVGFYADAGKIKLEINPDNARAANLRISAKLLEMARTVSKP